MTERHFCAGMLVAWILALASVGAFVYLLGHF